MSYRGRGRGRGGFGRGFRPAKQVSFEFFPEIEGLGKAEYSTEHLQLIQWSHELQRFWKNSPYNVKDSSQQDEGREQQSCIERYSDRKLQATTVKSRLSDYMELGPDYLPAELSRDGKKGRRVAKRVRWQVATDLREQDLFERLLKKDQEQEGADKKEEDEEEDEENNEEEEEEYSDEGDYEQGEYFDDDEDDFNMPESEDEAIF